MKTLYLSGAISNNPNYKQDFEKAYKDLTEAGYTVISPLHIRDDRWCWETCMRHCIEVLVSDCDDVAVIQTPFYSRGMKFEIDIAENLAMIVELVEYWIKRRGE